MRKQTNSESESPKGFLSPKFSDSDFREVRGKALKYMSVSDGVMVCVLFDTFLFMGIETHFELAPRMYLDGGSVM
jgi:hypothetical protein